ncbi:flagellar basal-body rod protein FlgB [Ruminiclostridium papyrosolvens DSM 2782]|uniref:Flagellar basal body rod protein FlgB n=1 Tax=Ruminiclostridium papyrosolvens DSM 2782 TaxID=588581 RepID=F1THQ4_9FIRM|nr:flagellar basal body rod protein FlgB [Ruminiclostridium papyrosolvens]EGD46036.1 flagellar basal-body rod protein FlgB [Ruminiclostridium papyrosolvens DSM 2782]WES32836.1 flagellar basal body rod protein FlgB [Ruminiclostridium papyrosolvens DSM 2782]
MIEKLYEKNNLLEKSLNASWARNEVISQNLANVDTPNYKRKDVTFEEYLNDSLDSKRLEGNTTDERHIPIKSKNTDKIKPEITQDNSDTSMRIDGNNVDIDSEMAYLAKNTIQYNSLIQMINSNYSRIKNVISEGRR